MPYRPGYKKAPDAAKAKSWHKFIIGSGTTLPIVATVYRIPGDQVTSFLATTMDTEAGDLVMLGLRKPNQSGGTMIKLSELTVEELDSIKEVIDLAFDEARPLCIERDQLTREAENSGDYTQARSNRPSPRVVVKKVGKHSEGVPG